MKKKIFSILILVFAAGAQAPAAVPGERQLHVIPYPKKVEWRSGVFTIGKDTVIVPGDPNRESDKFVIGQLRDEIRLHLGFSPRVLGAAGKGGRIVIGLATDPAVAAFGKSQGIDTGVVTKSEGYVIGIGGNGILLAGADEAGTFYAAQTLKLMLRGDRAGAALPKLRIDDWPDFPFRGITDDISRGPVPTMDTIKQTIRRLSELKINKFNFYIEHVFKYNKHPDIGPEGGSLTADDIREIDAYAKEYHIELIGGLQSFGHFDKILKHKKYAHLAENPAYPWVLTPARKESYELLGDLYSEIAPPFSSKLFNISCDETWGLGEGQSRQMVQKKGIAWTYAYHIRKVHGLLAALGKRIMMWADIALKHPDILEMLPQDIIFLPWSYDPRDNFDDMLDPISKTKHDFIVCPGANCWSRMFPNVRDARINIGNFARDGARFGSWGVLNTTWDDDGENLFGYNWYPLAWGAEVSWNPMDQNPDRFHENFPSAFFGAPGPEAAKGIALIEKAAQIMSFQDLNDSLYWEWPVWPIGGNVKMSEVDTKNFIKYMEKAERSFLEAEKSAVVNRDNLEFLLFATRRMLEFARRRLDYFDAAALYQKAYDHQSGDPEKVAAALARVDSMLERMQSGVGKTWSDYQRVWKMENRPYWLDNNAAKYTGLDEKIGAVRKSVRAAAKEFKSTGKLTPAKDIGLPLPEKNHSGLNNH